MRMIAIWETKPATRRDIKRRLESYEKDLEACEADLKKEYENGNPDWMPNAVDINRAECERRIAHYIPAIKELKWVLGEC